MRKPNANGRIPNSGGGYIKECPVCGSPVKIRNSARITLVTTEYVGSCQAAGCGAQIKGFFTWVAFVSPSGLPKHGLDLPVVPEEERLRLWRHHVKGCESRQIDLVDQLESEEQ
ncbi:MULTISPECIES: ogr/Delta-like zinc finger family protein [Azotobacter]|uniref:ogr/Delta-like zinc finger family protein n=1 Tax=Azotobacter TaxID=352 RepID=UPI0009207779|nr:ogr/Delta-like zinc finger family protein [Azotobacter vinelandii]GLK62326.1 hypothetical protein GCM10017624_44900 [Azotobacter vinelandii]SFX44008.1 Ogr/Delta-like zinc finger [Azotobacter vinelandii]